MIHLHRQGKKEEQYRQNSVLSISVTADVGTAADDILLKQNASEYRIGFWKNGSPRWQGSGIAHTDNWQLLGCHDMDGDGQKDVVATGCVQNGTENVILYIGYYRHGIDNAENWVTLGNFMTPADAGWAIAIGNLTGKENCNSVVWYSAKFGKLGAWTDGSTQWTEIPGIFGSRWEIAGCGDFEGCGKESVLMNYDGGATYYSVDLAGNLKEIKGMGAEWELCGIGDLDGKGQDNLVFVHEKLGLLAKWSQGKTVNLGQIDTSEWQVLGCGRYSGGKAEDILVRNKSNGMVGYYVSGNLACWREIGKLAQDWTII